MQNVMEKLWCLSFKSEYIRWQLNFAQAALEAESIALLLLDDEGENLVFANAAGKDNQKYIGAGRYSEALRVPMGSGIGMNPLAVFYNKPMSMEQPDSRHNPAIDKAVGTKTRSLFTIPLATQEETLGTLSTINVHRGAPEADHFTPADQEVLNVTAEAVNFWLEREWKRLSAEAQTLRNC